ncbi:MAG: hypothetical protein ACXV0U_01950 [Kineosporiaceae bacterium]
MASTPTLRGETIAGAVLWRAGPGGALGVAAVGVAAAVLVPLHLWQPIVALPVLALLGAVGWRLLRLVPARPTPVWASGLTVLLAAGFTAWAAHTHGEQVVLRRDAGSYALFAQWLATRHGLPIDGHLDAFGGAPALGVPGFTLASPGFFQVPGGDGAAVVPQFLLGAPAAFSLGWWATGGWTGLFLVPALLGGLGLLGAGAVTARLVGPRWAPLAVAALGLAQPVLEAARTTFSEPAALVLVLGAAAVAVDAVAQDVPRLGLLAGGLAGLAGLVRVDALREVALLVPVCALLALRGSRAAVPMALAALAGTVLAAVPAVALSRPYLEVVEDSLKPLVVAMVVLTALGAAVLAVARIRCRPHAPPAAGHADRSSRDARVETHAARTTSPSRAASGRGEVAVRERHGDDRTDVPDQPGSHDQREVRDQRGLHDHGGCGGALRDLGWAPIVAGGLVVAAGVLLATRPWWSVAHQGADDPGVRGLEDLQRQQGLPVDGTRTYAEQSLIWVAWYTGVAAIVLAWGTFTVVAARATRWWLDTRGTAPGSGAVRAPGWLLPAAVGLGSTVLTLYRPGITPDHPWADRRIVVVVLPTIVIAAVAAVAWIVRAARRRAPAPLLALAAVAGVAVLVVPPAWTTAPVALLSTERGEPQAANAVCAALHPGDAVVALGGGDADGGPDRSTNEWPQVVRGVCGLPSAVLVTEPDRAPAALDRLADLVHRAGGRLVLLAAVDGRDSPPSALTRLGLHPTLAVRRSTFEAPHWLMRPAAETRPLGIEVWTAPWPDGGTASTGR